MERFGPRLQNLPRGQVLLGRRMIQRRRHQRGEDARPGLERLVGIGSVVRRHHFGSQRLHGASTLNDLRRFEHRSLLTELAPGLERRVGLGVAGGQTTVAQHHAIEAIGERGRQAQTHEAAPVLAHQCEMTQVVGDQPLTHPVDVTLVGVVRGERGFVATSEPHQVRRHHAVTGRHQHRNHLSIQEAPRGFAVHAQDGVRGVLRTRLHVSHAHHGAVVSGHVRVGHREIEVGHRGEGGIRSAQNVHEVSP